MGRSSEFKKWKEKIREQLPDLTISFYSAKKDNKVFISSEDEKLLGKVINYINDPSYSITDEFGKKLSSEESMADEVCLEILVEELFQLIEKLK
jgi:hypothetical protein